MKLRIGLLIICCMAFLFGMQILARQTTANSPGLWITRLTPQGGSAHPFDVLDVQFSGPVQAGSFTLADVTLTGPGGTITPLGITPLAADLYRLDLTGQTGLAQYILVITGVLDANGQPLDQNHDGLPGGPDDAYVASLLGSALTIQADDVSYDHKNLVLYGATATINGSHHFGSLSILGNGVVNHSPSTTSVTYSMTLALTDTLWIDSGAKIDVTGKGYLPGYTVGNTTVGGATGGSGGSHGGLGEEYQGVTNAVYGDFRNPLYPGASGTGDGYGGGLVRIQASAAVIDGAILANGRNSTIGGGGAGGGVWLDVGDLSGSGKISADGGDCTDYGFGARCGSGGGGRIAVYYTTLNGFNPAIQLTALGGHSQTNGYMGAVGSVYFKPDDGLEQLRFDSHGELTGRWTPLGVSGDQSLTLGNLVITGTNVIVAPEHNIPIVAENITVDGNGVLTLREATTTEVFALNLTVNNTLTIGPTGKIDVTGKGYLPGRTAPNTTVDGATGASGGSHGGLAAGVYGAPNPVYDDPTNPLYPGASGTGDGYGGGLLRIQAQNVVLNGSILANGRNSTQGGGGAGGGILLNTGTISGAGTVSVNGGNCTDYGFGARCGPGSGGRVALYYTTLSGGFDPAAQLTAVAGVGSYISQPGSTYASSRPGILRNAPRQMAQHGLVKLAWTGTSVQFATATVKVEISGQSQHIILGESLPVEGKLTWDSTSVPDGRYEIRYTLYSGGQFIAQSLYTIIVNNAATWHSGPLTSSETWTAGTVHILANTVEVDNGQTLTINPGVVVKATGGDETLYYNGVGIAVLSGGVVNILASGEAPQTSSVLTTLSDDSVGGDTNFDGLLSAPIPGQWRGPFKTGTGVINQGADVDLRYIWQAYSGNLTASQTWKGTWLHLVEADVNVLGGAILSIEPGAVIKFAPAASLNLQSGSSLQAVGLAASQIVFTSQRDDTAGGDSNHDGNATSPNPGDWFNINVMGANAVFKYTQVRYGGGGSSTGGAMVRTSEAATASIQNSIFEKGLYHGIQGAGGTVTVQNSVIAGNDRGVMSVGGSVTVLNCTLDSNRVSFFGHGGTLSAQNNLVTNYITSGFSGNVTLMRYNDVWSSVPGSTRYDGPSDQTGLNGNISVDPGYRGAAQGNYHLQFASPVIDAADGAVAPETDFMGAPRYDDPRTPNTGLPTGSGAYADMGAYEFVETAPSDLDLVVNTVSGPTNVIAGEYVTLTWNVVNVGTGVATGPWYDRVALTSTLLGGGLPLFAGDVLVGQGVTLGPGQSYQALGLVRVPGGAVGAYSWQVTTNIRRTVFEGQNQANNTGVALAQTALNLPELKPGNPALAGQFAEMGQAHWFRIDAPANQDVLIQVDSVDNRGRVELYLGCGFFPTPTHFTAKQTETDAADVSLYLPGGAAQTCYGAFWAATLPGGAEDFLLSARVIAFELLDVSPRVFGDSGYITLDVLGGQLNQATQFQLVSANGIPYNAAAFGIASPTLAHVVFHAGSLPQGVYDLRMSSGSASATLPQSVLVAPADKPSFWFEFLGPETVAAYRVYGYTMAYGNDSNVEAPPTILRLHMTSELRVVDMPGQRYMQTYSKGGNYWIVKIFLPALAPHEQKQIPVLLQIGKPGTYNISIFSLTLAHSLGALLPEVDPNVMVDTDIVTDIPNQHLQAVLHVQGPHSGGDLNFDLTIEPTTTPISPTITKTEANGNITWQFETTVESVAPGKGVNALQGALSLIKETVSGGKDAYDQFQTFKETNQSAQMAVTQAQITNMMYEKGWISEEERDRLLRENEGGFVAMAVSTVVDATPAGDVYGSFLEAVAEPAGQSWDMDLINITRIDPNSPLVDICLKYGIDPYNFDPDLADKLKAALLKEMEAQGKNGSKRINVVSSVDPNDKTGAQGAGEARYITANEPLRFSISFENMITATAPAQVVLISDTLDLTTLDPATFQFGPMYFGTTLVMPPGGLREYHKQVDLRPTQDLLVQVDAVFDSASGVVTWQFTTLDPATFAQPEDPLIGFLPPNQASPEGQGSVSFTIKPKPGLPSGTIIENQATITFDRNPPIQTPPWRNTLDVIAPSATMTALPAISPLDIPLSWSGSDDTNGSGIAYYDLYVSVDGGPLTLWRAGLTVTNITFKAQPGKSYGFSVVAVDNVGHPSSLPASPQASTRTIVKVFLPLIRKP